MTIGKANSFQTEIIRICLYKLLGASLLTFQKGNLEKLSRMDLIHTRQHSVL